MYEEYWGLSKAPFNESHSRENFVDYPALDLARIKLRHIADHGQCAAAIVGPAGVGKTALAQEFGRELQNDGWAVSYIVNPHGDPENIIKTISHDLGASKDNPSEAMFEAVENLELQGRRACIIVDEAHTIKNLDLLENIRMLMNFEINGYGITVILVGQEGLVGLLKKASSFNQRLSLKIGLAPMDEDESKHYILSRLKFAGCNRGIFTRSAADKICELSKGIPRDINRICELAMIVGYGFALKKIKGDVINMVKEELNILDEGGESKGEAKEEDTGNTEKPYVPLSELVRKDYQPEKGASLSGLRVPPPVEYKFPEEKEKLPSFGLFQATYGDINEDTPVIEGDIMAEYDNINNLKPVPEDLGEDILASVDGSSGGADNGEDILANL